MKVILISLLVLSFANSPGVLLAMDSAHSIAVLNEHGVDHLVLFHRADSNDSDGFFAPRANDEHHEIHLSASTGLIQKRVQLSSFPTDICPTIDPVDSLKRVSTYSVNAFEPDIGVSQAPLLVLRI